ncbi:Xaa-Pro dipeptidyl-peptidase [Actinocatenispora rupis]|uniref:X-Pro dipeptidyl-peptidase n=1 Tax=Actinocatenispora rupis TaxID=519421 RepID=A0A8J3J432_9ACTN|nr:Xaa-Pro dipeptidyl-peptidase [Actinocatenispora rupis]GID14310.1 X-Pro dipeptidyl-peptidase [Actinocatenispora rupis]
MENRRSRRFGSAVLTLLAALALVAGVAGPVTAAPARPFVHGTETVPTYSYADAVRESVRVDTRLDNDGDGKPDTVTVDIVRPRAAVRIPVIMEASPYYSCCGRGNESQVKKYDASGTITSMPLYYDNYFVPRGYAFVGVDLSGTSRSTGCGDVGAAEEVGGAKAVIDWLNGRATAHHLDGSPAVADWTTGTVGMIGKSWDGTIANGVAATGVRGLATIVPVSGISSWYDYMRLDGVPRADGYPGWLAGAVDGRPAGTCAPLQDAMNTAGDDATGDYNAFWRARDYVPDASKVRASVLAVHGLNDQNVFPRNVARWWDTLAAHGVPRKLWLHQEGHTDPFDIDRSAWVTLLHHWFDHWLQGLDNGVMKGPRVTVERAPGQFVGQADYPAPGAHALPLSLGPASGGAGTLGTGHTAAGTTVTMRDNTDLTEAQAVGDPNTARTDRTAFLSAALPGTVHLSGTPTVTLRFRADKDDTELTAKLVDYGRATRDTAQYSNVEGVENRTTRSCWGGSTDADSACYLDTRETVADSDYGVLSRGWTSAAHHGGLTSRTPIVAGRWYMVTIRLQPQDQLLAAGHHLGLVLSLSDEENTSPVTTGASVTVDLPHSRLDLPVAGPAHFGTPTSAPRVTAHPATTAPRRAERLTP